MTRIGITGHQVIPAGAQEHVERGITRILSHATRPILGFTSLAAGADQTFAECAFRAGAAVHVVLPCEGYESTFADDEVRARFRRLLGRADSVERLSYPEPSEEAFLAAGMRIASSVNLLIAVWDGEGARGKGGTADIVEYARSFGVPVKVVWPSGIRRPSG